MCDPNFDYDLAAERVAGGMIDPSKQEKPAYVPKSFQCPDCYKTWPSKMSLVAHRREHSSKNRDAEASTTSAKGSTVYLCKPCGRSFAYYKSFIDHKTNKCPKSKAQKK